MKKENEIVLDKQSLAMLEKQHRAVGEIARQKPEERGPYASKGEDRRDAGLRRVREATIVSSACMEATAFI